MNDGNIPEAKCPKCGTQHFGWALLDPKQQKCKKCGAQLEMVNKRSRDSVATRKGESPLSSVALYVIRQVVSRYQKIK